MICWSLMNYFLVSYSSSFSECIILLYFTIDCLTQSVANSGSPERIIAISRYTLFVAVCKEWENYFFTKKLSFVKHNKKYLHTIRHRPQFSRMCIATENATKKVLWNCQKTAYSEKRICKSFSQNTHQFTNLTNHSLHTIRVSQESIRSFFIIVPK